MWKYKIVTNMKGKCMALAYFEPSTGIYRMVPFEGRDHQLYAKNYCTMKNAHIKEEEEFLLSIRGSLNNL